MPKTWLYFLAILFPLAARVLIVNTAFTDWLWYNNYPGVYYALSALKVNPTFLKLIGGWPLPVFIVTVISFWMMEEDDDYIPHQFLLLPIAYVPFMVIGAILVKGDFDTATIYGGPIIVVTAGYLYILPWAICIWVFDKLGIVL